MLFAAIALGILGVAGWSAWRFHRATPPPSRGPLHQGSADGGHGSGGEG